MKLSSIKNWCIDVNNVILSNQSAHMFYKLDDYSPNEIVHYMRLVPNALEGIKMLTRQVGLDNVWFLSKADNKQRDIIRLAFDKFRINYLTGIAKDQLIFVPEDRDKVVIARSLELEGLIDNEGAAIFAAQDIVTHPFWFAPAKTDIERWVHRLNCSVRVVSGWKQLIEMYHQY